MNRVINNIQEYFIKILLKFYFCFRNYCLVLVNICLQPKLSTKYGAQLFFLMHIKNGDTVLDIGCNNGDLTYLLASKASHIDAFDISKDAISYAKKNNKAANISYLVRDAMSIVDTCSKHYNVTVLGAVLSFIDKKKDFLLKLAPLTDRVLIRETKFDNEILALLAEELGIKKSRFKEFRKLELISLLENCGFNIIDVFDTYDMFIAASSSKQ